MVLQALLCWVTEQPETRRPHWLCPDLHTYILQTGGEYCGLEDQAVRKGNWLEQERDSQVDLMLEMSYTRLRGSINQVKYGRIENLRNRAELQIFETWLEDNRDKLTPNTTGLVEDLVRVGKEKCGEVEAGMEQLVSLLSAGHRDRARETAEGVEKARAGKRDKMRELMATVSYVWRHEDRDSHNISFSV